MNFLAKVSAVAVSCFSLVYALPNYINYTIIRLDNDEVVRLEPITQNGAEGVNYLVGGKTTSGQSVTLRDHFRGDGMVVITDYTQRKELVIVANPEVQADSSTVHSLLMTELSWLKTNGIVNMTDEAIADAVAAIMAGKASGWAVSYSTHDGIAEPIVGGCDVSYQVPPSQLQIGATASAGMYGHKQARATFTLHITIGNSSWSAEVPAAFMGATIEYSLFCLDGKRLATMSQTMYTHQLRIGGFNRHPHNHYILKLKKGDAVANVKIM